MSDLRHVTLRVDGREVRARAGDSVAAAIMNSGSFTLRTSITGEPRGPLCGIGHCHECRMSIDGRSGVRACITPCRDGMIVSADESPAWAAACASDGSAGAVTAARSTLLDADAAIIGAGPAGLAAAEAFARARPSGRAILIDDQPAPGGQIWRSDPRRARLALATLQRLRIQHLHDAAVVNILHHSDPGGSGGLERFSLHVHSSRGPIVVRARRLVLATGARERFLPFPGWTLPGVTGVGGLQALVKSGLDVRGRRVVVAGSGPLLLAVACFLLRRGARVLAVAEQAPSDALARFALGLWRHPATLARAGLLRAHLLVSRAAYLPGTWPVEATGDDRLRAVRLTDDTGRTRAFEADFLACAFGLVPNLQASHLLGCRVDDGRVVVDDRQQTTLPGVFAAGETCGVGGVEVARAEGRIAGLNVADPASPVRSAPELRAFARALEVTFALRPELGRLARPDTVLCRCEDVRHGFVAQCGSWREAKLQTRCGMGPCQGRVCGPAARVTLGFHPTDARPPLEQVPMSALAHSEDAADAPSRD